jgi:tetratricopeptide (TPR) repeat protein
MPSSRPVRVHRETVTLPTYLPKPPDRNPMFLEKRVYQGSSGRVYPLPFTDRVADRSHPHAWDAIIIENEYLQVVILPQLGGRVHRILDKTNGFDAIYHQPVIKPALVGLAGPWASGGIEFNWPQHHRPSTFMPADVAIENHSDGSATVWLSEHDPMTRLKGMHGVRLHPGAAMLELVARVYNRTTDVHTFLWWANVAIRVHEQYQSFFPPDATHIADHAKRATDTYPLSTGSYYGVDYAARARTGIPPAERPRQFMPPHMASPADKAVATGDRETKIKDPHSAYPPNDLSWYANIPVPTSYMCTGSDEDFCGGYDHRARAGLIHLANRHIAPGKKQWTWGNHEFGYAWDRNLTEPDARGEYAPYIELMSGVYTDNQPDFSYLQPGETKTWSQFWYPIREIGPAQQANLNSAVSLRLTHGEAHVGVVTTSFHRSALIELSHGNRRVRRWTRSVGPDRPFIAKHKLPSRTTPDELTLRVYDKEGRELITYNPKKVAPHEPPAPATEPPLPAHVASNDELFIIGLHLEQYRHATRSPADYWREAVRRDPRDSRAHLALGRWHLRRGELTEAEAHLRTSIARLTSRNPNPYDGEAYYQLGRCLVFQSFGESTKGETSKIALACAAFYKATWNHAWQPAGYHALAELDARRGDWSAALGHLDRALRLNADNLRARDLRVIALRRLGRDREAAATLRETLALDPLDWWAQNLAGAKLKCDVQVLFDLALDHARAGLFAEALDLLAEARPVTQLHDGALADASLGTAPLLSYYRAWLCQQLGRTVEARRHVSAAAKAPFDYCFPARLEEIAILQHAMAENPRDARAPFYLGQLLYDRRRHREAIKLWERAVRLEPNNAIAWRNLGIGCYNVLQRPARALRAYERAFRANPRDARLLFERDQLWKRLNYSPKRRLRELLRFPKLVAQRDDLSVELCALFNQTGAATQALSVISKRKFQPWEGGEGQTLGQHVRTHLMLGRAALAKKQFSAAIAHFQSALTAPENLGEARHLLANQSDVHFWLGTALAASSDLSAARRHWTIAAEFKGDFQTMSVRPYSEMTYYSALALQRLDRRTEARQLLFGLLAYARTLASTPAKIDYFATSLPTMLLFDDDLQARQLTTALFLEAQAHLALGKAAPAQRLLRKVLKRDPNHALAADLLA